MHTLRLNRQEIQLGKLHQGTPGVPAALHPSDQAAAFYGFGVGLCDLGQVRQA